MLEQDKLLIESWDSDARAPSKLGRRRRTIRSLTDNVTLGFAVWTYGSGGWHSCLAGPAIQVCETEDASLLMVVRRRFRWSRSWAVYDADNRLVGRVRPHSLVNNRGRRLASVQREADPAQGRFLGLDRRELASFQTSSDGSVLLVFGQLRDNNPFSKMIVLGAILAWL